MPGPGNQRPKAGKSDALLQRPQWPALRVGSKPQDQQHKAPHQETKSTRGRSPGPRPAQRQYAEISAAAHGRRPGWSAALDAFGPSRWRTETVPWRDSSGMMGRLSVRLHLLRIGSLHSSVGRATKGQYLGATTFGQDFGPEVCITQPPKPKTVRL
ncbi:hypothetical protein Trco_002112 [Trichoderma cornu-damae]|uniref:Uncharacterized protein n=1 Tax=Trichoderma cornu-damae TaxID=654480 RepID=A0A9P8TUQ8_9HYPO|nr:hypothetical protein Trco_002112 [Trichoderma cornu-damae]